MCEAMNERIGEKDLYRLEGDGESTFLLTLVYYIPAFIEEALLEIEMLK